VRLFIALNLPAEVRSRIATDVLKPLRAQLPGVRWVREETLHVTLLFLGKRSEAEAHQAQGVVREVAAARKPVEVSLSGLGAFPSPARPRVVWLGLVDPAPVQELHRALERERARLGLPLESCAFYPHVTLGRVPQKAGYEVGETLAPMLTTVQFKAPVTFSSVDLMSSELIPRGPRYTALLTAPLGCCEER
jgi:2'-5' RNA ligase